VYRPSQWRGGMTSAVDCFSRGAGIRWRHTWRSRLTDGEVRRCRGEGGAGTAGAYSVSADSAASRWRATSQFRCSLIGSAIQRDASPCSSGSNSSGGRRLQDLAKVYSSETLARDTYPVSLGLVFSA
jgi:hypothetical protein